MTEANRPQPRHGSFRQRIAVAVGESGHILGGTAASRRERGQDEADERKEIQTSALRHDGSPDRTADITPLENNNPGPVGPGRSFDRAAFSGSRHVSAFGS